MVTLTDPTTRKGMQRNIDRLAMPEAVMTEIKQMIAQAQAKNSSKTKGTKPATPKDGVSGRGEKIELARRDLYIEQGKALPRHRRLASDINLGPLRAHAIANNWDDAREAFLAARQRVIDENDLLGQQE